MPHKKQKLLLNSRDIFNQIRKSPFKIFIRANNWEPVGIMTKKEHRYDSSWGQMRFWAVGLTLDGKKFEEPVDRKNRRTGEIEDLVQMETDFLVITARKTGDPDDDNEDNFQYLMNPHASNRMKDAIDRLSERERIIQDMQKKMQELMNQRDYFEREAEASGSEIRQLKSRIAHLSEKNADLEQSNDYYKTLIKSSQIQRMHREGGIDEKMSGARDKGAFEAKDSSDVIVDAAKKQKEAKRHLTDIGMSNLSGEYVTQHELKQMEDNIMNKLNQISGGGNNPSGSSKGPFTKQEPIDTEESE